MWFDSAIIDIQPSILHIKTHSQFAANWINKNFKKQLEKISYSHGKKTFSVEANLTYKGPHSLNPIKKDEFPQLPHERQKKKINLLKFEDYIVGPCNQIAYGAAKAMASGKSQAQLLVIHGPCGVGKSHLLQASALNSKKLGKKTRYLTGETFTNQFISAIKSGKLNHFRKQYRNIDLLAIDDVHFIAGKERTREEFIHTIDALELSGQNIMLATDSHPKEIQLLNESLRSRLLGGLVLSIDFLDKKTLASIAYTTACQYGLKMDNQTVDALSLQSNCSARELIGTVTKLSALRKLDKTLDSVPLISLLNQTQKCTNDMCNLPISKLLESISSFFNVSISMMQSKSRANEIKTARTFFTYLARKNCKSSFTEISKILKRKHHSSLLHAAKNLKNDLEKNSEINLNGKKMQLNDLMNNFEKYCHEKAKKL